jgi:hypothetical protein
MRSRILDNLYFIIRVFFLLSGDNFYFKKYILFIVEIFLHWNILEVILGLWQAMDAVTWVFLELWSHILDTRIAASGLIIFMVAFTVQQNCGQEKLPSRLEEVNYCSWDSGESWRQPPEEEWKATIGDRSKGL